jgi:hypothetical protein
MSNVINFNGDVTYADLDPKEMVENAMKEFNFREVVLIGWTGDKSATEKMTVCTSSGSTPRVIYSLELAKASIIDSTGE